MNHPPSTLTNVSLLAQLREDNRSQLAWQTFVDRYGRRIYEWSLSRGLQPADAEDVTQEVLVKLARRLGKFDYDPNQTFRGWLRRVTENAVIDFCREATARKPLRHSALTMDQLLHVEARASLSESLADTYDLELYDVARERVRSRVQHNRWMAWELLAVDQWKGDAVADRLNMKLSSVYASRHQIQQMIAEEVRALESSVEERLQP